MGNARHKPSRLAEKLYEIRNKLGLSQNQIIEHLGFNDEIKRENISRFETGTREPDSRVVLAYAQGAGVVVDVLLDDDLNLPQELPCTSLNDKDKEGAIPLLKTKLTFKLDIQNTNGSTDSEKVLRNKIEAHLKPYSMKKTKSSIYELQISYVDIDDLNKRIVRDILQYVINEGAKQLCLVKWDIKEPGTSRHW